MMSVREVATKLKVSDQHVRSILRSGQLHAEMIGKQWIIDPLDLETFIKDHGVVIEPDDHERDDDALPELVALSFFSGAMGLDIGMEKAGIKALLACEFDKSCRMTIQQNRPDIALIGDINRYSATDVLRMAKIPKGRDVDVIFGGPPCQAFSTAGSRRGFSDERGNVFLRFISIVSEIKPKYVVIENVRGLLSAPFPYNENVELEDCSASDREPVKGGALLHIIDRLRIAGYTVSFELYNAANFGAPQIRERVVIIGRLGDVKVPYLTPSHSENGAFSLPAWRNLSEALKSLPKNTEHHHVDFPEERLKYYRMLKEGQYWKNLPIELQKEAMGNSFFLGGGKTGFYRRLSFNKPSPTLVTHPAMPATDLAHPTLDRPLSVEEYAVIQEFPQTWKICGSVLDQYKQIGNAVPIALGEAIGNTIINHMNGVETKIYPGFKYSRYKGTDDVSWERNARSASRKHYQQIAFAI
jgi:DNA (cytosine-5)-methyltransferase 1